MVIMSLKHAYYGPYNIAGKEWMLSVKIMEVEHGKTNLPD
jgi:hypothetical protein